MRLRAAVCIVTALAICAGFGATIAHSQAYAIYLSDEINVDVPTTNLGGGGNFSEEGGSSNPIVQTSAALAPFFYSNSVSAIDPCTGALGSAWSTSSVSDLAAYNSTLYVSVSTSGGVSGSACLSADGIAVGNAEWTDTLHVAGLPSGTPVTVKVTDSFDGGIHLTGLTEGSSRLYHGIQVYDATCGSSCGVVSPDTNYTTSQNVLLKKSYLLHAFSGDTLLLLNVIYADLNGGGSGAWTGAESSNAATIYVDALTPHAVIWSASHLNYSTPGSSSSDSVPAVIGESQSAATTAIEHGGFVVGTISKQASTTVAAGTIISQSPAPGTEAAAGSAVDLILSTGPIRGDVNFDGTVDSLDVQLIEEALGAPATGPTDPRDLNHDGTIDAADVRIDESLCTYPQCATSPPADDVGDDARRY